MQIHGVRFQVVVLGEILHQLIADRVGGAGSAASILRAVDKCLLIDGEHRERDQALAANVEKGRESDMYTFHMSTNDRIDSANLIGSRLLCLRVTAVNTLIVTCKLDKDVADSVLEAACNALLLLKGVNRALFFRESRLHNNPRGNISSKRGEIRC